jgi:hypothetical protein
MQTPEKNMTCNKFFWSAVARYELEEQNYGARWGKLPFGCILILGCCYYFSACGFWVELGKYYLFPSHLSL